MFQGYVRVFGSCNSSRIELAAKFTILPDCVSLCSYPMQSVFSHILGGKFTYKPVNPTDPVNTTVSFNAIVYNLPCLNQTTFCSEVF